MELCKLNDLQDGEARGFQVLGLHRKVIVVRKGDSAFGYLDSCPHYEGGTPMAWRTNAYLDGDGVHLACHSHGALFDIETGECVLGPCLGQSLTQVSLAVSKEGGIDAAIETFIKEFA